MFQRNNSAVYLLNGYPRCLSPNLLLNILSISLLFILRLVSPKCLLSKSPVQRPMLRSAVHNYYANGNLEEVTLAFLEVNPPPELMVDLVKDLLFQCVELSTEEDCAAFVTLLVDLLAALHEVTVLGSDVPMLDAKTLKAGALLFARSGDGMLTKVCQFFCLYTFANYFLTRVLILICQGSPGARILQVLVDNNRLPRVLLFFIADSDINSPPRVIAISDEGEEVQEHSYQVLPIPFYFILAHLCTSN